MSVFTDVLDTFGIGRMPWVARAFLLLIVAFLIILVTAATNIPDNAPDNHLMRELFNLAADGLKLTLGAFVGSLTQKLERTAGAPPSS